jgi:glutamate 5-kinase
MQIAALNDEFVIVSSGAIAASKQFVKLESRQRDYSQTSLGLLVNLI